MATAVSSGPPPELKEAPTIPVPMKHDPYDIEPETARPLRNSKGRPIAPHDDYDHDEFPFGPPVAGKYTPKNPNQKYRLLVGQYVGEDGIQYLAGVQGRDICPESTKHPEGLARWPEKFQPLLDDAYSRAPRVEETIEELEARLAELKAKNGLKELTPEQIKAKMDAQNPPPGTSVLDTLTVEELLKVAEEEEVNLRGAKTKEQILKILKQSK